MDAEFLTISWS